MPRRLSSPRDGCERGGAAIAFNPVPVWSSRGRPYQEPDRSTTMRPFGARVKGRRA